MRFAYIGPEVEVTIFGATFRNGEPVEITDPHAIAKLKNHAEFISDDAPPQPVEPAPRKRGRPHKVMTDDGENQI